MQLRSQTKRYEIMFLLLLHLPLHFRAFYLSDQSSTAPVEQGRNRSTEIWICYQMTGGLDHTKSMLGSDLAKYSL